MSRYREIETEKSHKSYQARIWWALWAVCFVVLVYTVWTQYREYDLVHHGNCIVADYYVYNGEKLAKYYDEETNHAYRFNLEGWDAIHEEDTIKMYYWTDIHAAEPHRNPMLWIRSYVIFGIAIVLISFRLYRIYTAPYEIYDVREIEQ